MEDSKLAKGLKCSQYQKYCGDCFPQSAVCPVIFSSCDVYTCFVIPGTCFSRNLPCFTLNTSRNVPTSMFYYTPQDDNTSKMSITWTQRCLGMERCKTDRAKGRLGDKIEEVLLVLAAFKTLDQFDVFRIELLMSLPQQKLKALAQRFWCPKWFRV